MKISNASRKSSWQCSKKEVVGFEAIASTPDEFAARIVTDIPKWRT